MNAFQPLPSWLEWLSCLCKPIGEGWGWAFHGFCVASSHIGCDVVVGFFLHTDRLPLNSALYFVEMCWKSKLSLGMPKVSWLYLRLFFNSSQDVRYDRTSKKACMCQAWLLFFQSVAQLLNTWKCWSIFSKIQANSLALILRAIWHSMKTLEV